MVALKLKIQLHFGQTFIWRMVVEEEEDEEDEDEEEGELCLVDRSLMSCARNLRVNCLRTSILDAAAADATQALNPSVAMTTVVIRTDL